MDKCHMAAVLIPVDSSEPLQTLFGLGAPISTPTELEAEVLAAIRGGPFSPLFSASLGDKATAYWVPRFQDDVNERAARLCSISDIHGDAVLVFRDTPAPPGFIDHRHSLPSKLEKLLSLASRLEQLPRRRRRGAHSPDKWQCRLPDHDPSGGEDQTVPGGENSGGAHKGHAAGEPADAGCQIESSATGRAAESMMDAEGLVPTLHCPRRATAGHENVSQSRLITPQDTGGGSVDAMMQSPEKRRELCAACADIRASSADVSSSPTASRDHAVSPSPARSQRQGSTERDSESRSGLFSLGRNSRRQLQFLDGHHSLEMEGGGSLVASTGAGHAAGGNSGGGSVTLCSTESSAVPQARLLVHPGQVSATCRLQSGVQPHRSETERSQHESSAVLGGAISSESDCVDLMSTIPSRSPKAAASTSHAVRPMDIEESQGMLGCLSQAHGVDVKGLPSFSMHNREETRQRSPKGVSIGESPKMSAISEPKCEVLVSTESPEDSMSKRQMAPQTLPVPCLDNPSSSVAAPIESCGGPRAPSGSAAYFPCGPNTNEAGGGCGDVLPLETLLHVFGFLAFADLHACVRVNRRWRQAILNEEELLEQAVVVRKASDPRSEAAKHPRAEARAAPVQWMHPSLRMKVCFRHIPIILIRAAEAGNTEATAWYAECLESRGSADHQRAALEWRKKAARKGHQACQYLVGKALYRGDGDLMRDPEEALSWLLRCVKNPVTQPHVCSAAALLLGYMYLDGEGTERADVSEAIKWLKLARDLGCKEAEETVGWLWNTGQY